MRKEGEAESRRRTLEKEQHNELNDIMKNKMGKIYRTKNGRKD